MITIDEQQLGWFLARLMDDYETLSELYQMRDQGAVNEVYLRSLGNEIEAYKDRAEAHRSELSAFLSSCDAYDLPDERAAFEAWAADSLGQGYPLTMDESGYDNAVTRWAFVAWKAGRRELLKGKE